MATPADSPALRDDWRTTPSIKRLAVDDPRRDDILERHRLSVEVGLPTYIDPASGFSVFTAAFLAGRGYCCESGCRHCPFVDL